MKCGNITRFVKLYRCLLIFIIIASLFAICIILKFSSFPSPQQKAEASNRCKSYTSIEIRPGDSLWSIASEHMTEEYESIQDYVSEIKSINGLGSDEIHAGRFLLIPYYIR